jgi:hypothetical protein
LNKEDNEPRKGPAMALRSDSAYEEYLKDLTFPAAKVQIISYAGENGASQDILDVLGALPVRNYNNIPEIIAEIRDITSLPAAGPDNTANQEHTE